MISRTSVAMTAAVARELESQLLRSDGQEDLCLATYRPSTGSHRRTSLVTEVLLPSRGDRAVHGNATVFDEYVLRAIEVASGAGGGVVMAHSHPDATTWQFMSTPDRDTESAYANLVRETTGLPLVGMTLAGRSRSWSARHWDIGVGPDVDVSQCENVRVIGDRLEVTWNDRIRPAPTATAQQVRTISCWGLRVHADISRLRILVVGAGSVGLDVAVRLAATGFQIVGVVDFDDVETQNLDRMIGATARDVRLRRSKAYVAKRVMAEAATADAFAVEASEASICEPQGRAQALDYDLIMSCVDRPWPRALLNALAYTDLIPVIDGGIVLDTFDDGTLRNGTWRSHVVRPGRPCMSCSRQLDLGEVALDMEGLLNDPTYVRGRSTAAAGQNVAALSVNVTAALLAQLVSYLVAPGGLGDPGPLQYLLSTHTLERLAHASRENCPVESSTGVGDDRIDLTGEHVEAESQRRARSQVPASIRALRFVDHVLLQAQHRLGRQSDAESGECRLQVG